MKLSWSDARAIGEALFEEYPQIDPLTLSFVQLHRLVLELDGFEGDAKGSTEKHLEAIQMIWYEEWKIDHD